MSLIKKYGKQKHSVDTPFGKMSPEQWEQVSHGFDDEYLQSPETLSRNMSPELKSLLGIYEPQPFSITVDTPPEIICKYLGHVMYKVAEKDNGRSVFGEHKCSRCGYVEPFQFDYNG